MKHRLRFLLSLLLLVCALAVGAQKGADDDIWRKVTLDEVDFAKQKNYCVRLFGYYRSIDDGVLYAVGRQDKMYDVMEGICAIDVRYKKKADDGSTFIVGRNLVHPDREANTNEFFEITPYTFLEKARHNPKHFTIDDRGDTLLVHSRRGLAGTVVADTISGRLTMDYGALAPDTTETLNLVVLKGRLSNVQARAVYRIDDGDARYVPQGNLEQVVFDGNVELEFKMGVQAVEKFREVFEFYVDSVAYMTHDEYKADKKHHQHSGYTEKDIDRLKAKHGVPPLSHEQMVRIEEQRDWEDMTQQWAETNKMVRALTTYGENFDKALERNEQMQQLQQKLAPKIEEAIERGSSKRTELE